MESFEKRATISLLMALSFSHSANAQCYQGQGCGGGGGGYQPSYGHHYSQPMPQPLPQLISQPVPQPQPIEYYYKSNSYSQSPLDTLASMDKEPSTASVSTKSQEYEEYDKKLPEQKATLVEESTPTAETVVVTPSRTYIREESYQTQPQPLPQPQPYQPHPYQPQPLMPYQPYQPRPVAYRPLQMLPAGGCGGVPPQYYRPAPYMPRGYVMPYAPGPTYPPLPPPPPPPQPYPTAPFIQPPHPHQLPINDCCGRCSSVCGSHARRIFAQSAKTVKANKSGLPKSLNETELNDTRCASKELREIMDKISYRTPSIAKRLIQRIAEEKLGGMFAVFCSKEDFTYVTRSKVYCQTERDDVVCYAFQHN